MKIKFWGVRGSLPSPLQPADIERRVRTLLSEFAPLVQSSGGRDPKGIENQVESFLSEQPPFRLGGFGGNTPCVQVSSDNGEFIIDAGSGLRALGAELMKGPCGQGKGEVHLLFTHFHWDHLIGLPFFTPIFIPGNTVHVWAVQPDLPEVFKTVFKKPFFPLNLEQLGAKIEYHQLEPRQPNWFGELLVIPYELDHPDPCWGFRISDGKKSFAHCVDTECKRISPQELGLDLPLYQNLDLMVFDAQYTLQEAAEKVDWGHAAAAMGMDLAIREKIPRVIFMHHDPASSDDQIEAARKQADRYLKAKLKEMRRHKEDILEPKWEFAQEGMLIELS